MIINEKEVLNFNDKKIVSYNVSFENGFEFEILNLGGVITKIVTPDKDNNFENIVVGYDDIKSYIENPSYFGAIIGRTSGRIYNGKFILEGNEFDLAKNYNPHNGHGGNEGFNKKIWDVEVIKGDNKVDFKLTTKSFDMEESFPGNLDICVNFEVKKDFEINQTYTVKTDKTTLVNLTNHTYFNLSGDLKRPVTTHNMKLDSEYILEIDETCGVTGEKINVKDTPFDFRNLHNIGDRIDSDNYQIKLGNGYDHPFLLNNTREIYLEDDISKRCMTINTNQEVVVVYSMNFTDDCVLYNKNTNQKRFGICFETQAPPIGKNMSFIENSILKKDETYIQNTSYKFFIK